MADGLNRERNGLRARIRHFVETEVAKEKVADIDRKAALVFDGP